MSGILWKAYEELNEANAAEEVAYQFYDLARDEYRDVPTPARGQELVECGERYCDAVRRAIAARLQMEEAQRIWNWNYEQGVRAGVSR
jgi:hypothetical protein